MTQTAQFTMDDAHQDQRDQTVLPPGSLEDIPISQDHLISPDLFTSFNGPSEGDTALFYKYFILYLVIPLLTPVILILPLTVGAYLIIRYDTQARGKLIERVRSILFLAILIVVFIATVVTTFPVWTVIGATTLTVSFVVMSVVGPPVLMVASGVFVATKLMQ